VARQKLQIIRGPGTRKNIKNRVDGQQQEKQKYELLEKNPSYWVKEELRNFGLMKQTKCMRKTN
jgi:hypothetical protein